MSDRMTGRDLVLSPVGLGVVQPLTDLFREFAAAGEERFFAPHPFTPDMARRVATYAGRDFYGIALHEGRALAYGMLRGWDEGFEVPSLGIGVRPGLRGIGLGLTMMHYLHSVAALCGAERIRLRVHHENVRARALYLGLGYDLNSDAVHPDFLVGEFTLRRRG